MGCIEFSEYAHCLLCPWECGVNRIKGEKGRCEAPSYLKINDYIPHFGEEACLVGKGGSGAIFISHCSLRCVFCQTYEISWKGEGIEVSPTRFMEIIMELISDGCENINFITPTHYVPHIKYAIEQLRTRNLKIPVIYNTSSFEKEETIDSLAGYVDIYLADMKYWSGEVAAKLCGTEKYPDIAKNAIKLMYEQVGNLLLSGKKTAQKGLMIRHLVLPGLIDESLKIVEWIAKEVSSDTYVNIMGHFRPCHLARTIPFLNRTLRAKEYYTVLEEAKRVGLTQLDRTHSRLYHFIWSSDNGR